MERIKKLFNTELLPFSILTIYSLVNVFILFVPFAFSIKNSSPIFISGFEMFVFLQDRGSGLLYYGVAMVLFGYILGGLCFLVGMLGLFSQKVDKKYSRIMMLLMLFGKFGVELFAIIAVSTCSKMNVYLEMGFYINVILSGLIFGYEITWYVLQRLKRIN